MRMQTSPEFRRRRGRRDRVGSAAPSPTWQSSRPLEPGCSPLATPMLFVLRPDILTQLTSSLIHVPRPKPHLTRAAIVLETLLRLLPRVFEIGLIEGVSDRIGIHI
ncbi:uncharacterized protein BO95DRAFT_237677 [Aspergillus brunneoviolaceus CBS 621.78]|uniref:Uncharacterized protein n=1 Tax=Aspergillus brunneoviolaceus CBS 621.78 TaxID=1450534 RepID=A0ACD1FZB8_9EURO|nr:hypothetical protein BO95DRAFT_237677 [Aspergillus brunneoviolaceus CBS 621.78]RAH42324.1 hypothetical protein BO95DRAFT_237677 [Aspergillus brunneoviolaceus CBS 621.78]